MKLMKYMSVSILIAGMIVSTPAQLQGKKENGSSKKNFVLYDVVLKNGRVISTTEDIHGPVFDKVCNVGILCGKIAAVTCEDIKGREEVDCCGLIVQAGFTDPHMHGVGVKTVQYTSARDGVTTTFDSELGGLNLDHHLEDFERRGLLLNYGESSSNITSQTLVYSGQRAKKVAIPTAPLHYSTLLNATATNIGDLDLWNAEPSINFVTVAGLLTGGVLQNAARYGNCWNTNSSLDAFLTYFNGDNLTTAPAAVLTPSEEVDYFKTLEWGLQHGHVGIGILNYNCFPFIKNWAQLLANSQNVPVWQVGELTDFAKKHIELAMLYNATIFIHSSLNSAIANPNTSTIRIWLDYVLSLPKPGPRIQFVHATSSSAGGSSSSYHNETIDLLEKAIADGWTNISYEQYSYTLGSSLAAGFSLDALLAQGILPSQIVGSPVEVPTPGGEPFVALSLQAAADMLGQSIQTVWASWQQFGVTITIPNQRQSNIDYAMKAPHCTLASDGIINLTGGGNPRRTGNFGLFLRRYVRELKTVSIPDAVRKLTSLTLKPFKGLSPAFDCKGEIRVGFDADITCWNPKTVSEMATPDNPSAPTVGIPFVLVNGKFVVKDEQVVEGVFPGKIIWGDSKAPGRQEICARPFCDILCNGETEGIFESCFCSTGGEKNGAVKQENSATDRSVMESLNNMIGSVCDQADSPDMIHKLQHAMGGCC